MNGFYDLIGIGVGPSNLALAIALQEQDGRINHKPTAHFFEQKENFSWHAGMLLPGATVQVSYLKDLVTLRNPCSPFSFLNFLKAQGRLQHFVNLKEWYPSRVELNEYFTWVARQLSKEISYRHTATDIKVTRIRGAQAFAITLDDSTTGKQKTVYAKNLSLACGGVPYLPDFALSQSHSTSICHSASFLPSIRPFEAAAQKPYKFTVVGRGQSAAEIATYLLEHFPQSSVTVITQGFSFMAVDDNPFTNEIFFNEGVDLFAHSTAEVRDDLHEEFKRTNVSVADRDLLERLYRICYEDRLSGAQRLKVKSLSTVTGLHVSEGRSVTVVRDKRLLQTSSISADLTIFATGYKRISASPLLSSLGQFLARDTDGALKIDRFSRVETVELEDLQLFIQGDSENAHGISSTLLSVLAFRSGEIADQVRASINVAHEKDIHAAA